MQKPAYYLQIGYQKMLLEWWALSSKFSMANDITFINNSSKKPPRRGMIRQVPYVTKTLSDREVGESFIQPQNGGRGEQNEFESFSSATFNRSLSNNHGLCLLEERKSHGRCSFWFVLSQKSFSRRIHRFRRPRRMRALRAKLQVFRFRCGYWYC